MIQRADRCLILLLIHLSLGLFRIWIFYWQMFSEIERQVLLLRIKTLHDLMWSLELIYLILRLKSILRSISLILQDQRMDLWMKISQWKQRLLISISLSPPWNEFSIKLHRTTINMHEKYPQYQNEILN